ncbi:hypothetical protein [Streptomyces lunaelactis]|uniref:hypothetical protein n=1 Tax=Streptomyces lunaelactis TaxID=1535768 RepID=UPI001584A095|nr:hypothetical protein [Streptomyces lunaelactis]NUK22053.1 hypothetical protein [Streptomyces lunaelactis]
MILALIIFPTLTILSACALVALAPRRTPGAWFLPAVRTIALVTVAVIYVAAIWSHP